MGRVGDGCAVLVALCATLLPPVSAAFDYQNVLDETIAMYILIGIAALFFTFTVLLLLIAAYCCCKKNRRPQQVKKAPRDEFPLQRVQVKKPMLDTIQETHSTPSPRSEPRKRTPHRAVKRLKSDEHPLVVDGASLPLSLTDIDVVDMPENPTESHKPKSPIQKTPDLRRKKMIQQDQTTKPISPIEAKGGVSLPKRDSSKQIESTQRLPGAVSPVQKTPDQRRKKQTAQHPAERKQHRSGSPATAATAAAYNAVVDAPEALPAIRRSPDPRLDSPRQLRRGNSPLPPIGGTTSPNAASLTPHPVSLTPRSSTKKALDGFILELDQQLELSQTPKKSHLDTSFMVGNPGFRDSERKVQVLALQRQLKPVAQHWYAIGGQLKVSHSTLKWIRTINSAANYEKCLGEVCLEWVKIEKNPTWDKVVVALRALELVHNTRSVADEIQTRFCQDLHSSTGSPDDKSNKSLTSDSGEEQKE